MALFTKFDINWNSIYTHIHQYAEILILRNNEISTLIFLEMPSDRQYENIGNDIP